MTGKARDLDSPEELQTSGVGAGSTPPPDSADAPASGEQIAPIEPITLSVLGRLFGVPLIIIAFIVGGSVLVVLLFGAPTSAEPRSIDDLMQVLESSSGAKNARVLLLPKEKELWQAALELTNRLEKKDSLLSEDELISLVSRLAALVRSDLPHVERIAAEGDDFLRQRAVRSTRLGFAIHALGRTGRKEAVAPLVEVVAGGREPFVSVAMQELANLHEIPEAHTAVEPILALLGTGRNPETLLTACTALSVLADEGNARVIAALRSVMHRNDGEIAYSAAIALARLGSDAGRLTLLDLLDRSFWESGQRYQVRGESGQTKRYAMPPYRIDNWLIASMDAASHLQNDDVWAMIERLGDDRSPSVQARARALMQRRPKADRGRVDGGQADGSLSPDPVTVKE